VQAQPTSQSLVVCHYSLGGGARCCALSCRTIEIVTRLETQTTMAAVREEDSADAVDSPTKLIADVSIVADDVFANGDENVTTDSNFLHAGYGSSPQILPRKSSLIKDSSRGSRRKKTVSFSSMPGERTVVNGACFVVSYV